MLAADLPPRKKLEETVDTVLCPQAGPDSWREKSAKGFKGDPEGWSCEVSNHVPHFEVLSQALLQISDSCAADNKPRELLALQETRQK
jgi:hypothetical protein